MGLEDQIQEVLKRDVFSKQMGIELDSVTDGQVKMSLQVGKDLLNAHGTMHGGAIFTLADITTGIASLVDGQLSVTLEGSMHYIKPIHEEHIFSISDRIHSGNTTGVYHVDIINEAGDVAATGIYTIYKVKAAE